MDCPLGDYVKKNSFRICVPLQETWVPSLGQEDPLEEEMATHSSILAWKIPWTEELGGLQSMESQSQTWLNNWASTPHLRVDSRNEVMHEVIPGSCAFYLECAFPNHPTFKITTNTIHYHKIVLFTLKNKPVCQHVPCGSSGVIFQGEMSKTRESEDKSALSSATGSLTAFASHLSSNPLVSSPEK